MSPTAFARAAGLDELRSPVHATIYIQSYILSMTDRIFACDVET